MWEIVPCTRVISVIARQLSFLPWLNIMRMENRGRTLVANDSQVFTGEELSFLSFWFSVVQSSISLDDTSCNYDSLLEPQVESNYCQAPIQDLSLLEPHVESRPKPKLQILWCKISWKWKILAHCCLSIFVSYLKSNYGWCCAELIWFSLNSFFIIIPFISVGLETAMEWGGIWWKCTIRKAIQVSSWHLVINGWELKAFTKFPLLIDYGLDLVWFDIVSSNWKSIIHFLAL